MRALRGQGVVLAPTHSHISRREGIELKLDEAGVSAPSTQGHGGVRVAR